MKIKECHEVVEGKMPLSNLTVVLQLIIVPVTISLFVLAASALYFLTE